MPTLKCQTLLNNLHQKEYHYFNDEDIIRIMINTDDEEWYALTHSKRLLQFYLDNPDSGIPYDGKLLNDEAMMGHYDTLYYHIAKNMSRMLTLSPSLSEMVYENITGQESEKIKLSKHPFVWILGVLYILWVILLFSLPGSQPFWESALIAVFGGPEFILSLIFCFCILQFAVVGIYDLYLVGLNYYFIRKHNKSEYGKLAKRQTDYVAASLTNVEP